MKILYVAMKYDYGDKSRGLSFEHATFYDSLVNMGHDLTYFDFMTLFQEQGFDEMNSLLWDQVLRERPELVFCVLFRDELNKDTIKRISTETETVTLNWFCDDHWRFDDFSRHWAPMFNWVTTTASSALPKYKALGYDNVIKTQWACNHFMYKPCAGPLEYDVTFVGQVYGNRRQVVSSLRQAGIDAHAWGFGWENGRLSQEEMIRLFSQSRINLNLTAASRQGVLSFLSWKRRTEQIKGRNFEVPGCGGFLLSGRADNLEQYYELGAEIVCFDNTRDLVEKARYHLAHEEERARIAEAGYLRTLRDHTYEHRFNEIFARIGLQ
jgi:spore maturation protein CgeB